MSARIQPRLLPNTRCVPLFDRGLGGCMKQPTEVQILKMLRVARTYMQYYPTKTSAACKLNMSDLDDIENIIRTMEGKEPINAL